LSGHLGLADCGGCLNIDDHCVLEINQIVRSIGKEGPLAACRCPARGRIGHRQLLGGHRGCAAEGGIIKDGQILTNGMASGRIRQSVRAANSMLAVHIGADEAAIDRKTFTAN
jgi:hypothetical protein